MSGKADDSQPSQLRSIRPAEHRVRGNRTQASDGSENTPLVRKFQFAAFDRGFGFNAEQLIERSQRLHAHHRGKVTAPATTVPSHEPVVLNATSPTLSELATAKATPTLSTTTAVKMPTPKPTTLPEPPLLPKTAVPAERTDVAANSQPQPTPRFHPQPPVSEKFEQPLAPTLPVSELPSLPVGPGRAFCAFAADFCIPFSIFISFVVTEGTWQPGFEQMLGRLAARSHSWQTAERIYLLFPWILPILSASGLTLLTQYFCGMLGHNSFGRSLCGMHLKKINSIMHIFWIAVFEAVSFGGLLALPLLFLMPSRLPFFPWVQFRAKSL